MSRISTFGFRDLTFGRFVLLAEGFAIFLHGPVLEAAETFHDLLRGVVDLLGHLLGNGFQVFRGRVKPVQGRGLFRRLARFPLRPRVRAAVRRRRGFHAIVDHAQHEHRRIVDAHLPFLPQPDDARPPVVFRHRPEVAPDGRLAVFVAARGPFGHGIRAEDQLIARITHLVENCEFQEVVAAQIDAAQHDRIGLELGGSLQRKRAHQLAAADLEEATVAQGEGHQAAAAEGPALGARRPRRRGRRATWRRPPSAASPSGTRPGCWCRCWRPSARAAAAARRRTPPGRRDWDYRPRRPRPGWRPTGRRTTPTTRRRQSRQCGAPYRYSRRPDRPRAARGLWPA